MEIGRQIRKHRVEMRLSQDELAERIFVSRQTVSNWENDKTYPDLKSLVLLSALFGASLDILIKGDLEKMKQTIKDEDMAGFRRDSIIYSVLMLCMAVSPVPLIKFVGIAGAGIWAAIAALALFFAVRIERMKKTFDIQTYKEIVAFSEGSDLSEIEKHREYGKRPYQKVLLGMGAGVLMIAVSAIMYWVLF